MATGPGSRRDEPTPEVSPSVVRSWLVDAGRPYVGWALIVIGALALFLAWYGVSDTTSVAEEIPYLASGTVPGLACIVLGGRFLLIEDLRRDSGRLDRLEAMVADLHAVLLARTDAVPPHLPEQADPAESVLVTTGGTTYHRPDCVMLEGRDDKPSRIKLSTAAKRGLTPCPLCEPAAVHA